MESISEGYAKDAYVARFDCQSFFMSIHKPTLRAMAMSFVDRYYTAPDKDIILRLLSQIILHCPHKNCVKKTPEWMWKLLGPGKSLFTCGDDYGLPIGNLSSQILANFYLTEFDRYMTERFGGYYGRYVDDFFILSRDKNAILSAIPDMKMKLSEVGVTLHPRKMYIQHVKKGISFVGGVVKPGRRYVGNRTVHNFRRCIAELNGREDKKRCATEAVQRINSYLGFFGHYSSYGLRIRTLKEFDKSWWRWLYVSGSASKVIIRKRHDKNLRQNAGLCSCD